MSTETKKRISNIASVGIIFRRSNPGEVFIEVKDDGHPIKLVRRQLCLIGGNWIGEGAKNDRNPLATFRREFEEELSFERPLRDSVELELLGMADAKTFSAAPDIARPAHDADYHALRDIKEAVAESVVPFGDFLNTIPKSALDSADPTNTRDGFTALASYWVTGLDDRSWKTLTALQESFGNLSNESVTLVATLSSIISTGTKTSFGHDRILQRFFLAMGLSEAKNLPLVPEIESMSQGPPLATYADYLENFDVAKRP